jgi:Methyltransferase domain
VNLSKTALRRQLVRAADAVPPLRRLREDRDRAARDRDLLAEELRTTRAAIGEESSPPLYAPGHFYSPIPDLDSVTADAERIFAKPDEITGVDLRRDVQLATLASMSERWDDYPYYAPGAANLRYRPDNDFFGHMDGLVLYGMLTTVRPKRYVEVGSGWSSALVLDTRERLPDRTIECTFIEPYPDRLHALLRPEDHASAQVITRPLQHVDLSVFDVLESDDVLFIDSSHVSKVGSDVHRLFFDVLPRLRPGVWVHVHDIGYPFEYPRPWIYEGRAWNEAYLLRALLVENPRWRIELWCNFLHEKEPTAVEQHLPSGAIPDGLSLWMRRQ